MSSAAAPAAWRNRIVRSGDALVSEIAPNERNWRTHPQLQRDALGSVLDSVGYVQQVVINARSNRLVDGRLRVALAEQHGETSVPALWVDLDNDEERLTLATLDPLGALAETNRDALSSLLGDLAERGDALGAMLDGLAARSGLGPPFDPMAEWQGMPAFEQEDQSIYRTVYVHFDDEEAVRDFARPIGQTISDATKTIWHPGRMKQQHGEFVSDEF